jgi:hypothetical protein
MAFNPFSVVLNPHFHMAPSKEGTPDDAPIGTPQYSSARKPLSHASVMGTISAPGSAVAVCSVGANSGSPKLSQGIGNGLLRRRGRINAMYFLEVGEIIRRRGRDGIFGGPASPGKKTAR